MSPSSESEGGESGINGQVKYPMGRLQRIALNRRIGLTYQELINEECSSSEADSSEGNADFGSGRLQAAR